jgi:SpoVK/Ycf46/Vps4 family AAA+-type ATPase
MDWDDLVLHPATLAQIRDIQNWVTHNVQVMGEWGLGRRVKPGYRALFYGPPGTGKTLTATLLGKHTGRSVFRTDLSRVVSKYIGETEQNLARLFDRAESKDWILFFDEADALFGKRTEIRDAHDKYANQQAAYLLQRIETFDGLVILATNQRNNIDEAFMRRFQSVIHFPMPRKIAWSFASISPRCRRLMGGPPAGCRRTTTIPCPGATRAWNSWTSRRS